MNFWKTLYTETADSTVLLNILHRKFLAANFLSCVSTEEITDLYQNVQSFLARIKYMHIIIENYCFNIQIQ
jgi:hypothetical protein